MVPYKIVSKDDKPYVEVLLDGKARQFAPEEVSAMILVKMKEIAEAFLGKQSKIYYFYVFSKNLFLK